MNSPLIDPSAHCSRAYLPGFHHAKSGRGNLCGQRIGKSRCEKTTQQLYYFSHKNIFEVCLI